MAKLLPRPSRATVVRCPSCGHLTDEHTNTAARGCDALYGGCACRWTPNDIAYGHGKLSWEDGYRHAMEAVTRR
jgi:hypothetical protein